MSVLASPPIFIALSSALTIFWIFQLVACYANEPDGTEKIKWLIFIALTHFLGATSYYLHKKILKNGIYKNYTVIIKAINNLISKIRDY